MALYDVVFPLKLGPLTYSGPPGLAPGTLVEAEVGHTLKKGILLRQAETTHIRPIKGIRSVVGNTPFLSNALLNLMTWMSGYYLAKEGMILKEFSGGHWPISLGAVPPPGPHPYELGTVSIKTGGAGGQWPPGILTPVLEQIKKRAYKGFLLHAPSTGYAESLLCALLGEGVRGAIVLCPEIAQAESVFKAVSETAGERACLFHSGMTKKLRREALKRMTSNRADIVVGVRSAVFAPLREVSLIAVLDEESPAYKKEDGLKYHTRDVAVMRGYFEGASVLLSSICPSVESYYNALRGKYTILNPLAGGAVPKMGGGDAPRVRVIDMRSAKKAISQGAVPPSPCLSKELLDKAAKTGSAAFVINRKGYSLLECADCGHVPLCKNCGIPLVFHKGGTAPCDIGGSTPSLKCHYCAGEIRASDLCEKCGGHKLKPVGVGIERVEEEVRAHIKRAPALLVGGRLKKLPAVDGVIVGTKVIARRPELKGKFPLIGVISGDSYLQIPDFRAHERAFQEFLHLRENLSPGGELLIQSRTPSNPLFKYIKGFDFEGFYRDELSQRKALRYPPFVKTALVTLRAQGPLNLRGAEALGPVETLGPKGKKLWKVLLKAPSRDLLLKAIKSLGEVAGDVDIDPA